MKVFEIIAEAPNLNIGPTTTTPSGIVIPQSAAPTPPTPTPPPAKTPAPTPNKAQQLNKSISDIYRRRSVMWKKSTRAKERARSKYDKNYGAAGKALFGFLNIVPPILNLYIDLEGAEMDYTVGYTDEDGAKQQLTQPQYEQMREYIWGIYAIQLSSVTVAMATKAKIAATVIRILIKAGSLAGIAVSGGASLAVLIGSEIFFTFLINFLSSDAGQNWLIDDFLVPYVKLGGKIPDAAVSKLTGHYETAEKKREKADAQKTASGKTPNKDIPKDDEGQTQYYKGIQITDANGKLLPNIEQNPRINVYRQQAKDAGQPDPLAGIPR